MTPRKVVDLEVDGIYRWDYPDMSDAFFSSAVWEDTGESLTEDELDEFTQENAELLGEMAREQCWS